jgi:hypothetical protein
MPCAAARRRFVLRFAHEHAGNRRRTMMRRFERRTRLAERRNQRDRERLQQSSGTDPIDNLQQIAGAHRGGRFEIERGDFVFCKPPRFAALRRAIVSVTDAHAHFARVRRKSKFSAELATSE